MRFTIRVNGTGKIIFKSCRRLIKMYEIAKHEFAKWENLLKNDDLTQYEKTLLSQINDNFDDIAAVGTARGGRSKLLGEIIKGLKNQTVNQISEQIVS